MCVPSVYGGDVELNCLTKRNMAIMDAADYRGICRGSCYTYVSAYTCLVFGKTTVNRMSSRLIRDGSCLKEHPLLVDVNVSFQELPL